MPLAVVDGRRGCDLGRVAAVVALDVHLAFVAAGVLVVVADHEWITALVLAPLLNHVAVLVRTGRELR